MLAEMPSAMRSSLPVMVICDGWLMCVLLPLMVTDGVGLGVVAAALG